MQLHLANPNPAKAEVKGRLNQQIPARASEIPDPEIYGFTQWLLRVLSSPFKASVVLTAPVPRNRNQGKANDVT